LSQIFYENLHGYDAQERKLLGILAVTDTHCVEVDIAGALFLVTVRRLYNGQALTLQSKGVFDSVHSLRSLFKDDGAFVRQCVGAIKALDPDVRWEASYKVLHRKWWLLPTAKAEAQRGPWWSSRNALSA
jgi:hypothetical protein